MASDLGASPAHAEFSRGTTNFRQIFVSSIQPDEMNMC